MALQTFKKIVANWVVETKSGRGLRSSHSRSAVRRFGLMLCSAVALLSVPSFSSAAPSYVVPDTVVGPGFSGKVVAQAPADHAQVLAAGFGFQAAGSSMITVRTYDAPTGAILSEDSFDVNVKEEGAAEHDENKGRIFAGGIGADAKGKSAFMLRVYDAESGRFLWEGQLNLLKLGEGGRTRVRATIIPIHPSVVQASASTAKPVQTLFSVRAVNPITGGLVWQDQFAPGMRKRARVAGVSFNSLSIKPVNDPIGHIFDLVVRTYDRTSGTLLWEDSFEQLDRIEEPVTEPETRAYPQAIPSWTPGTMPRHDTYQTRTR